VKLICLSHLKVGEKGCAFRAWTGKPGEKRLLGRQRLRWDDNIKMYLQVIGCGTWAGLTWFKIYCYKKSTMISGESLDLSSLYSVNIW
jgi:hypothetical protein